MGTMQVAMKKATSRCIWAEAGVVEHKLCTNHFNCHDCAFDRAMRRKADKNSVVRIQHLDSTGEAVKQEGKLRDIMRWPERMKQRTGTQRQCRHYLAGRAPMRLCPYNFECFRCPFDQMLEDVFELLVPESPGPVRQIECYQLPEGHYYHRGHTWVRVERGGRLRIGLDDFAARVFGVPDGIELPLGGEALKADETGFAFSRLGKEARVLSPVSGIVRAVNWDAVRCPSRINEDTYQKGWLMVLDPLQPKKDLKNLMPAKKADSWLSAEHQKLMQLVNVSGITYADGGYIEDVVGRLPDLDWKELTRTFLAT